MLSYPKFQQYNISSFLFEYKKQFFYILGSALIFGSSFHEYHIIPNQFRYLIFVSLVPFLTAIKHINKVNSFKKKFLYYFLSTIFFGLVTELIAFLWVYNSIENFFSTSKLLTTFIYILFCFISSFYYFIIFFPLFIFFYIKRNISILIITSLSLTFILLENTFPRISPWYFGYFLFFEEDMSQVASFLGPLGVSFFVFFVNLYFAFYAKKIYSYITIFSIIFSIKIGLNFRESVIKKEPFLQYKIGFIQPNFSPNGMSEIKLGINKEIILSNLKSFKNKSVEFVALPESIIYYTFGKSPEDLDDIKKFAKESNIPIATQYLQVLDNRFAKVILQAEGNALVIKSAYSKAVIVNSAGELTNEYTKWNPMPFGEILPFFSDYERISNYFFESTSQRLRILKGFKAIPIDYKNIKIGFYICYDTIDKNLHNLLARNGAKFLINLSNFYWMSNSNANFVFSIINQFKAIETERSVFYLTNNGPTILFDSFGHKIFDNKKILNADYDTIKIPYLNSEKESFYGKNYEIINITFMIFGIISYINFIIIFIKKKGSVENN